MMRILATVGVATLLLAGCAAQAPAPVVDRNLATTSSPLGPGSRPDERVPTYTVKRGETLFSIAAENRIDHRDLAAWNGITDPAKVQTGQVLRLRPPQSASTAPVEVPGGAQASPVTGAGALEARPLGSEPLRTETRSAAPAASVGASVPVKSEPKAVRLPYSEENLAALQRGGTGRSPAASPDSVTAPPATRAAGAADDPDRVDWSWPVSGKLLAGFSEAAKGIEIAARNGEPVYASAGGRVVYSGSGLRGYGKLVIIKHNEKFLSAYANNRQLLVKEGDSVTKGQKIAEVGPADSGAAKLHFEIRQLGKPVDPMKFLPER